MRSIRPRTILNYTRAIPAPSDCAFRVIGHIDKKSVGVHVDLDLDKVSFDYNKSIYEIRFSKLLICRPKFKDWLLTACEEYLKKLERRENIFCVHFSESNNNISLLIWEALFPKLLKRTDITLGITVLGFEDRKVNEILNTETQPYLNIKFSPYLSSQIKVISSQDTPPQSLRLKSGFTSILFNSYIEFQHILNNIMQYKKACDSHSPNMAFILSTIHKTTMQEIAHFSVIEINSDSPTSETSNFSRYLGAKRHGTCLPSTCRASAISSALDPLIKTMSFCDIIFDLNDVISFYNVYGLAQKFTHCSKKKRKFFDTAISANNSRRVSERSRTITGTNRCNDIPINFKIKSPKLNKNGNEDIYGIVQNALKIQQKKQNIRLKQILHHRKTPSFVASNWVQDLHCKKQSSPSDKISLNNTYAKLEHIPRAQSKFSKTRDIYSVRKSSLPENFVSLDISSRSSNKHLMNNTQSPPRSDIRCFLSSALQKRRERQLSNIEEFTTIQKIYNIKENSIYNGIKPISMHHQ